MRNPFTRYERVQLLCYADDPSREPLRVEKTREALDYAGLGPRQIVTVLFPEDGRRDEYPAHLLMRA